MFRFPGSAFGCVGEFRGPGAIRRTASGPRKSAARQHRRRRKGLTLQRAPRPKSEAGEKGCRARGSPYRMSMMGVVPGARYARPSLKVDRTSRPISHQHDPRLFSNKTLRPWAKMCFAHDRACCAASLPIDKCFSPIIELYVWPRCGPGPNFLPNVRAPIVALPPRP